MEISVRPGCCKVCYKLVNARQQAFQCDSCKALVHRLCGTGFSQSEYREIARRIRDGGFFEWQCSDCHVAPGQPQQQDVFEVSDGVVAEVGPRVSDSTHILALEQADTYVIYDLQKNP